MGELYSREEISRMLGGSAWASLPSVGNDVVVGCFRTEMNPNASHEILVKYGKSVTSSAMRLVEQATPVPVFLRRETKGWEFVGYFRGKRYSEAPVEVDEKARAAHFSGRVAGVLYLEKAD
jgi:hypothetical protein